MSRTAGHKNQRLDRNRCTAFDAAGASGLYRKVAQIGSADHWMRGLAMLVAVVLATQVKADGGQGQTPKQDDGWRAFMQSVWEHVEASPEGLAAKAREKAADASVRETRGDYGVSLNGSAQYYPDGLGATADTGVTNLEQRAELRLQWAMLDFIARRSGRIGQAEAERHLSAARARTVKLESASRRIRDAVCNTTNRFREQALEAALAAANEAVDASRAGADAPSVELARAAERATGHGMRMRSRVQKELASLTTCGGYDVILPEGFLDLPWSPPPRDAVLELAAEDPEVAQLEARAEASRNEARARRLGGIEVKVHGGYIAQRRDQGALTVRSTEPQIGASLSVPLSWPGANARKEAEAEAEALAQEAEAMLEKQRRLLEQLYHQWASAAAHVEDASERIEQSSERLDALGLRLERAVSDAPEPWEVALQRAELWLAIDEAWGARARWLEAVLLWSLRAPQTLDQTRDDRAAPSSGLCAPLLKCPS